MKRFNISLLITLSVLLASGVGAATLYKIVNADGSVTYTDTPQPDAEPVDLSKVNSAVMPSLTDGSTKPVKKTVQIKFPEYSLSFNTPAEQQTIRDNLGKVTVSATLTPTGNGIFQLFFDGTLVQSQPAPVFQLNDVERGEHKIQIKFKHHTGKILASTEPRVFYLRRASALINPN